MDSSSPETKRMSPALGDPNDLLVRDFPGDNMSLHLLGDILRELLCGGMEIGRDRGMVGLRIDLY